MAKLHDGAAEDRFVVAAKFLQYSRRFDHVTEVFLELLDEHDGVTSGFRRLEATVPVVRRPPQPRALSP
jgi:hypothetical protein